MVSLVRGLRGRRAPSPDRLLLCSAVRRVVMCFAAVGVAAILWPAAGRADEVDTAIDAFAVGGSFVGVTVGQSESEKELVKSIVRCAVERTPVLDCARKELVRKLPSAAQPLAQCLLDG